MPDSPYLRALFETPDLFVAVLDGDGNLLEANEASLDFIDRELEKLRGEEFWHTPWWDHCEELQEKLRRRFKEVKGGTTARFEADHFSPDGERVAVDFILSKVKVKGSRVRFLALGRDITEREEAEGKLEESEKRFRIVTEGSSQGVYLFQDDRFKFMNERFVEMSGYSREELKEMHYTRLVHPDFREKIVGWTKQALEGDSSGLPRRNEFKVLTKSGDVIWVSITPSLVHFEGRPAIVGNVVEITERKRAEKALKEEKGKLRKLHDAVDQLQRKSTEKELLQATMEAAKDILNFEACAVALLEDDYLVDKVLSSSIDPEDTAKFEVGEGIVGKTFRQGETIWGKDLSRCSEAKPVKESFKGFISVPIGEMGNFQVVSREVGGFDKRDVELAEILVGHLREELKRVRLEEKLRQQAVRDPLTDIYNRRYFNENLQKEVERSERYDEPIAFLMMDVNRFKEINDRYSHYVGDEVLREVAELIKENVRGADTVVRYGGDEFLVMMPETNGEVKKVVARLKRELADWNEESSLLDFPLTLAIGVSHWEPGQEKDVEKALQEADRKMYEDKVGDRD